MPLSASNVLLEFVRDVSSKYCITADDGQRRAMVRSTDLATAVAAVDEYLALDENARSLLNADGGDDDLWRTLRVAEAYNRTIAAGPASSTPAAPLVDLPPFCGSYDAVQGPISVEGREEYSAPLKATSGGKTLFGYNNLFPEPVDDPLEMILASIKKNRADATQIFLYTQVKRAKRLFSSSLRLAYFSKGEVEADKYDVRGRTRGPLPCRGAAALLMGEEPARDEADAVESGIVRVGDPEESPGAMGISITMLGHASMIVQFQREGITVVTDPVFADLNAVLYPRKTEAACQPHDMPAIDVILISHNHRDHVDEAALRLLVKQQPLVLVPLGDGRLMQSLGFLHVNEHNTWEKTALRFCRDGLEGQVELISVPANHWTCRGLNDANEALFLGWVLTSTVSYGSVYFAGDTSELTVRDVDDIVLNASMRGVYDPILVNLQPGGPNHRRETMQDTHTSAAYGILSHFQHVSRRARRQDSKVSFRKLMDLSREYLTLFMHHNVFELGVDRFNEALIVRDEFLGELEAKLAEAKGGQRDILPADNQFVAVAVTSLIELLEELLEGCLKEADYGELSDIIRNRVLSPKIGSTLLLRPPARH